jgi:hypothetical protein
VASAPRVGKFRPAQVLLALALLTLCSMAGNLASCTSAHPHNAALPLVSTGRGEGASCRQQEEEVPLTRLTGGAAVWRIQPPVDVHTSPTSTAPRVRANSSQPVSPHDQVRLKPVRVSYSSGSKQQQSVATQGVPNPAVWAAMAG